MQLGGFGTCSIIDDGYSLSWEVDIFREWQPGMPACPLSDLWRAEPAYAQLHAKKGTHGLGTARPRACWGSCRRMHACMRGGRACAGGGALTWHLIFLSGLL